MCVQRIYDKHVQLRSSINFFNLYFWGSPGFNNCKPGICWSEGENAQADFFSVSYIFLRRDHKFWQLNLVLSVSPHSTQLTLITADCAVVKVFNLISLYWHGHAVWSSDIFFSQRLGKHVDQSTAKRSGALGWNERGKKKMNLPIKVYRFAIFVAFFQTLLKSDFIDAVNTSEIHFPPKIFSKIQVRAIRKCGLYTPV